MAVQQLARWCNGQGCGVRSITRRGSVPSWAKSTFKLVSEGSVISSEANLTYVHAMQIIYLVFLPKEMAKKTM